MAFKDLIPWKKGERELPARREVENPFLSLHREIDHLFDDFYRGLGFGLEPFAGAAVAAEFTPRVDVFETDTEVKVTAELPGIDEKEIDVLLANDVLTIKGEKKEEKEEKGDGYRRVERTYGSFSRAIPLPVEVEADDVKASFKNGVLNVTLRKTPEAESSRKRIAITTD